jgi:exosome complex exonuclease DIS3/RRP44
MFTGEPKYDAENYTLTVPSPENGEVTIAVFDRVTVRIELEKDKNTQRGKVKMVLVDPRVTRAP